MVVTDYAGNTFPSVKAMCSRYQIKISTYYSRLRHGWTIEEALTYKEAIPTPLGNVLKNAKITTKQLAELTGIKKRTLDEYRLSSRNKSMSLENGIRIADALHIDPHELCEYSTKK